MMSTVIHPVGQRCPSTRALCPLHEGSCDSVLWQAGYATGTIPEPGPWMPDEWHLPYRAPPGPPNSPEPGSHCTEGEMHAQGVMGLGTEPRPDSRAHASHTQHHGTASTQAGLISRLRARLWSMAASPDF